MKYPPYYVVSPYIHDFKELITLLSPVSTIIHLSKIIQLLNNTKYLYAYILRHHHVVPLSLMGG